MAIPTHQRLLLLLLFTSLLPTLPVAVTAAPAGRRLEDAEPNKSGNPLANALTSTIASTVAYRARAREFLSAHNKVRRYVGTAPYVWNRTLAQYARDWAKERRADCECIHSGGPYGENMFWGTGNGWRATDAVMNWALEHYDYDLQNNTCRPGRMCGHYTQIVWNTTTMLGCARIECFDGGVIMVCNYDPPGNYVGERPFETPAA